MYQVKRCIPRFNMSMNKVGSVYVQGSAIDSALLEIIDQLEQTSSLSKSQMLCLLGHYDHVVIREELAKRARKKAQGIYGNQIYTRGLIEFTNYCKNDCYYCGIRAGNTKVSRYRLTKEDILECCQVGYELGFRTFVLQGGEDPYFDDDRMCDIVQSICLNYPDCAITLSLGERSTQSYQRLFQAGANRYLLRHETYNSEHYQSLHPTGMSAQNRQACIKALKQIGFQVGTGFMVGSPKQTLAHIVEDVFFIKELDPHMVGIGPFIPHHETPFKDEQQGSLEMTLMLLSIIRLLLPHVLLPSTTALGTIDPNGREQGVLAGANVVMPNLSPLQVRKKYMLYDNKICTGDEAAECRQCLSKRMQGIGYDVVVHRGDYKE